MLGHPSSRSLGDSGQTTQASHADPPAPVAMGHCTSRVMVKHRLRNGDKASKGSPSALPPAGLLSPCGCSPNSRQGHHLPPAAFQAQLSLDTLRRKADLISSGHDGAVPVSLVLYCLSGMPVPLFHWPFWADSSGMRAAPPEASKPLSGPRPTPCSPSSTPLTWWPCCCVPTWAAVSKGRGRALCRIGLWKR